MRITFSNISNFLPCMQTSLSEKKSFGEAKNAKDSLYPPLEKNFSSAEKFQRFFQFLPQLCMFWLRKLISIFSCSKFCKEKIDIEDLSRELLLVIDIWKKKEIWKKTYAWNDFSRKYPYQDLKIIEFLVHQNTSTNKKEFADQRRFYQKQLQNFDYRLLEKYRTFLEKRS